MKAALLEELFLTACAKVVRLSYNNTEYRNAVCEECRVPAIGGQMEHRCYWHTEENMARERMTCVVYSLQRLSSKVFAKMCEVIRSEHPKYQSIKADDVLEFLGGNDDELNPLEVVCTRPGWKSFVVDTAMKEEQEAAEACRRRQREQELPMDLATSIGGSHPLFFSQDDETRDGFGLF
jgi:hypothetical protein